MSLKILFHFRSVNATTSTKSLYAGARDDDYRTNPRLPFFFRPLPVLLPSAYIPNHLTLGRFQPCDLCIRLSSQSIYIVEDSPPSVLLCCFRRATRLGYTLPAARRKHLAPPGFEWILPGFTVPIFSSPCARRRVADAWYLLVHRIPTLVYVCVCVCVCTYTIKRDKEERN